MNRTLQCPLKSIVEVEAVEPTAIKTSSPEAYEVPSELSLSYVTGSEWLWW